MTENCEVGAPASVIRGLEKDRGTTKPTQTGIPSLETRNRSGRASWRLQRLGGHCKWTSTTVGRLPRRGGDFYSKEREKRWRYGVVGDLEIGHQVSYIQWDRRTVGFACSTLWGERNLGGVRKYGWRTPGLCDNVIYKVCRNAVESEIWSMRPVRSRGSLALTLIDFH